MLNQVYIKKLFWLFLLLGSGLLTGCFKSENKNNDVDLLLGPAPVAGQAQDGRLTEVVAYYRKKFSLPALAVVMVHDGEVIEMAVDGNRAVNSDKKVTADDRWHIGSITKSMTATLAAQLVKQGQLQWDVTIEDIYPSLATTMQPQYREVTLRQLLSNTSGLPSNMPTFDEYHNHPDSITVQRQQVVAEVTALAPHNDVGVHHYSNLGYMVAGAMMETVTGSAWELLMQQYVFAPLLMIDAGFAAPDNTGDLQQPVGHKKPKGRWRAVMENGSQITDNPMVLGPAGTVHASLADMGKYMAAHLAGAAASYDGAYLSADLFKELHTAAPNTEYALGWGTTGQTLSHGGSNTMWLAKLDISPATNSALFVVTNAADVELSNSTSNKATDELLAQMRKRINSSYGQSSR